MAKSKSAFAKNVPDEALGTLIGYLRGQGNLGLPEVINAAHSVIGYLLGVYFKSATPPTSGPSEASVEHKPIKLPRKKTELSELADQLQALLDQKDAKAQSLGEYTWLIPVLMQLVKTWLTEPRKPIGPEAVAGTPVSFGQTLPEA